MNVVEAQLHALQKGDVGRCFAFASPENRRATGPWQRFEMMVRQTPAYAPLVGCSSFSVLSALALDDERYRCCVRMRPAGSSSAPFAVAAVSCDYVWELRKVCEADGEESCWMTDGVMPDRSPLET